MVRLLSVIFGKKIQDFVVICFCFVSFCIVVSECFIGASILTTKRLKISSHASSKSYFSVPDLVQYANLFGLNINIIDNPIYLRLEAVPIDNPSECVGFLTAFIRPVPFKLLQLDTIQVKNRRQTLGFRRNNWAPDGSTITFIMGSIALRWAHDKGCANAELLAVKDSEKMHRILVRLYENFGFQKIREVGDLEDASMQTVSDRLVWGAVGTLMKIDIRTFLNEWTPKFAQSFQEKVEAAEGSKNTNSNISPSA